MSVTVPAQHLGAYQLQSQITALQARPDPQSAYEAKAAQERLVHTLLDSQRLVASTILGTVTVQNKSHPLWAQRSTLTALANTTTAAGLAAGVSLDQVERQLVGEIMASGQVSAATILSHPSLSYIGGAAH